MNTARLIQAEYYDKSVDPEFEINRPHGESRVYTYLMDFKFAQARRLLGESLLGSHVLVVCCGSGMDAEYMAQCGARVLAMDVSYGCLSRARMRSTRFGTDFTLVLGDAQNLPFSDATFDYALVHDGLHHLPDPERAVTEMARVTERALLILEPAQAAVTSIPTRLGLMNSHEDAGNYIYRLNPRRLAQLCTTLGFDRIEYSRYLVRYGHPPSKWWRLFDRDLSFAIVRAAFYLIGVSLLGRWGNKLTFVAVRTGAGRSSSRESS